MDIINFINALVLIIGLPTLLKVAVDMGKRLQVLNTLEHTVNELQTDMRGLRAEVSEIKNKVNVIWEWFSRHVVLEGTQWKQPKDQ